MFCAYRYSKEHIQIKFYSVIKDFELDEEQNWRSSSGKNCCWEILPVVF